MHGAAAGVAWRRVRLYVLVWRISRPGRGAFFRLCLRQRGAFSSVCAAGRRFKEDAVSQGVIFDMDGVLVASGAAHSHSWRLLARKHGREMSAETFAETFGMTSREIIRRIWGEALDEELVARLDEEKEALYRDLITGLVPLTIGTREVLGGLAQAGYVLAVATSGPPANLELVLRETGLGPYFAAVVNGFDVEHGKPAPDIFALAAGRAGLAPVDCVVVEDAPVGIQAARAAGMKVIGYAGTHPAERLQEAGADATVADLREVTPEVVQGLLSAAQ